MGEVNSSAPLNTQNIETKKRIEWIDVARGIGIFLMIVAHRASTPGAIIQWIYSFHMPLFFVLSGYLLKNEEKKTIKQFFKSKLFSLVIPYLFLCFTNFIIQIVYSLVFKKELSILHWIGGVFTGHGIIVGPMWFIPALFLAETVLFLIIKLCKGKLLPISAVVIIISIVFMIEVHYCDINFPFSFDTAMIGMGFVYVGYLLNRLNIIIKIEENRPAYYFSIVALLLISIFITAFFGMNFNMSYKTYPNVIIFYIGSIVGSIFTILFSILITRYLKIATKIVSFYGKNTLVLLAYHYTWGFIILETVFHKIGLTYGYNFMTGNIEGFVYAILVMLLLTPLILIFNRFLPWAVGKKRKNNMKVIIDGT